MARKIRKERLYNHPIESVWAAISSSEALTDWFMEADFKPEAGYRFTFKDKPQGGWDGVLVGEVLKAEPPHLLTYTWTGNQMSTITNVQWRLTREGNGTRVTLEHDGFDGIRNLMVGFFHQMGWNRFLNQLATHLAGKE